MKAIFDRIRKQTPLLLAIALTTLGCGLFAITSWLDRQPVASHDLLIQQPRDWRQTLESLRKYDLFHGLELIVYDWRVRLASKSSPAISTNVGLVAINDDTVTKIRWGYPLGPDHKYGLFFPRHLYARAIRELTAQGATAIGMDVLTPDERPDHLKVEWSGSQDKLDSDATFIQMMETNGRVVLGTLRNLPPTPRFRNAASDLGGVDSPRDVDGSARRVYAYVDCRYYSTRLLQFCKRQGYVVEPGPDTNSLTLVPYLNGDTPELLPLSADGRYTETLRNGAKVKFSAFESRRVWHLGITLGAMALGLDLEHPIFEPGRIILRGTNGVERILPVDHDASFPVDWTVTAASTNIQRQAFEELVRDDLVRQVETNPPPARWKDKVIVIGSTATGSNVSDLGATPLSGSDYLVATYINVVNSILQNRFVHRLPVASEFAIQIALSLVGGWVTWRRRISLAGSIVVLVSLGYFGVSVWMYTHFRLWMPVVHPLLTGLLMSHAGMLTWRVVFEQKEQKRVRSVFNRIVAPEVVQELLKAEQLGLGGARRKLTVFFADIRGFTEMTDQHQAEAEEFVRRHNLTEEQAEAYFEAQASEVLATVNLYLASIADVIKHHQGTLDKYIGDCVMAFWGAPTPNSRHAVDCVAAAVEAQQAIQRLNEGRAAENERRTAANPSRIAAGQPAEPLLPLLQLGTGVNTGVVTVGLMGSDAHILNYTVFGRDVNLASRLEGVSGRSRIIIGEETYKELQLHVPTLAALCIALEPVNVKGFRQPVKIYEVPWRQVVAKNYFTANPRNSP